MQTDAFVTLTGCLAAAELVLGGILLLRRGRRGPAGGEPGARPDDDLPGRLGVVSSRLALVAAATLPVLGLALQRAVETTPGVMCLQGVLREDSRGAGIGPALPAMLAGAVLAQLAVLLAAGTSAVLRRIDRQSHSGALAPAATRWLRVAGGAAVLAAAATGTYLFAPRAASPVTGGCCLAVLGAEGATSSGVSSPSARALWTALFVLAAAAATAMTWIAARRGAARLPLAAGLVASSLAATVAGAAFFTSALAPARLGLPFHECAFCLLQAAPELWVGVVLGTLGAACSFWAVVAARAAARLGLPSEMPTPAAGLLGAARFAWAASLAMAVTARWVA